VAVHFIYCRNNQKKIPFRESKLTRLVQDLFSGKGKASMIVNVNQCATSFDETLHTLKFSAIAKKVKHSLVITGMDPA
jgi:kinesin family protein 20